jgi:hypothetical protein
MEHDGHNHHGSMAGSSFDGPPPAGFNHAYLAHQQDGPETGGRTGPGIGQARTDLWQQTLQVTRILNLINQLNIKGGSCSHFPARNKAKNAIQKAITTNAS